MTRVSRSSEPESKKTGWRNYAAVGASTAVVAACLLFKTCGGGPITEGPVLSAPVPSPAPIAAVAEKPRECITVHDKETVIQYEVEFYPVAAPKEGCLDCAPAPKKGDKLCELDKGEGDHRSPNYDEASCGRCGNGAADPLEIPSVDAPFDRAKLTGGAVNFTPAETAQPDVCLADTHCGNGKIDRNVPTGALIPVQKPDGTTVYEYTSVTVNESCNPKSPNFCEPDCPTPKKVTKAPNCDDEVARDIYSRMKAGLFKNIRSIRTILGADDRIIDVTLVVDVDSQGVPSVRSGSVTCVDGCGKQGAEQRVVDMIENSFRPVESGRCTTTQTVSTVVEYEGHAR